MVGGGTAHMRYDASPPPPGADHDSRCRHRALGARRPSPRRRRGLCSIRVRAIVARFFIGAALVSVLHACATRNAVWIEPSSTAARVMFRVAQSREVTAPPSFFYG